jgi:hypothetical protein
MSQAQVGGGHCIRDVFAWYSTAYDESLAIFPLA